MINHPPRTNLGEQFVNFLLPMWQAGMGSITDNLLILLLTVSITITLIIIYYYYQDIYYWVVITIAECQLTIFYGSVNPRIAYEFSLCSIS